VEILRRVGLLREGEPPPDRMDRSWKELNLGHQPQWTGLQNHPEVSRKSRGREEVEHVWGGGD
jgi:hypothetical protein